MSNLTDERLRYLRLHGDLSMEQQEAVMAAAQEARADCQMYLATIQRLKAETAKDVAALEGGPGTPTARWRLLLDALEKRFPNPEPFRSDRVPEEHYLEAIDQVTERIASLEQELNEWKRGDVGKANLLLADRCVTAEHRVTEVVALGNAVNARSAELLKVVAALQWGSCDDCRRFRYCPLCGASNVVEDSNGVSDVDENAPHKPTCPVELALHPSQAADVTDRWSNVFDDTKLVKSAKPHTWTVIPLTGGVTSEQRWPWPELPSTEVIAALAKRVEGLEHALKTVSLPHGETMGEYHVLSTAELRVMTDRVRKEALRPSPQPVKLMDLSLKQRLTDRRWLVGEEATERAHGEALELNTTELCFCVDRNHPTNPHTRHARWEHLGIQWLVALEPKRACPPVEDDECTACGLLVHACACPATCVLCGSEPDSCPYHRPVRHGS